MTFGFPKKRFTKIGDTIAIAEADELKADTNSENQKGESHAIIFSHLIPSYFNNAMILLCWFLLQDDKKKIF